MNSKLFLAGLVLAVCGSFCYAQKIDNTAFYRDLISGRSIRVHYENDFFSGSDLYYTQGINLEVYDPRLANSFLRKMLMRLSGAKSNYGIAAEHLGFTPSSISFPTILIGDRPFAACLMTKLFSVSIDSSRQLQVSSTFSAGIIGPGAGGKQFQSAIHRWINDRQPQGWDNQIRNDLILNYTASITKGIVNLPWLTIATKGSIDLGTLKTKLNGGVVLMAGMFTNRWDFREQMNFQVYVYSEPIGSLVGYDATLQGGFFNDSPYTVSTNDITRCVFQNNSGIIFVIRNVRLEYFQSLITKEFSGARTHYWGGVRIGLTR